MSASEPQNSSGPARDVNINIRVRRRQRDLIDQAAALLGKSRSDFVLDSACRAAEDVLLDQRLFVLDAEAFERFQAALDAPPRADAKLRKLLATRAPWEP